MTWPTPTLNSKGFSELLSKTTPLANWEKQQRIISTQLEKKLKKSWLFFFLATHLARVRNRNLCSRLGFLWFITMSSDDFAPSRFLCLFQFQAGGFVTLPVLSLVLFSTVEDSSAAWACLQFFDVVLLAHCTHNRHSLVLLVVVVCFVFWLLVFWGREEGKRREEKKCRKPLKRASTKRWWGGWNRNTKWKIKFLRSKSTRTPSSISTNWRKRTKRATNKPKCWWNAIKFWRESTKWKVLCVFDLFFLFSTEIQTNKTTKYQQQKLLVWIRSWNPWQLLHNSFPRIQSIQFAHWLRWLFSWIWKTQSWAGGRKKKAERKEKKIQVQWFAESHNKYYYSYYFSLSNLKSDVSALSKEKMDDKKLLNVLLTKTQSALTTLKEQKRLNHITQCSKFSDLFVCCCLQNSVHVRSSERGSKENHRRTCSRLGLFGKQNCRIPNALCNTWSRFVCCLQFFVFICCWLSTVLQKKKNVENSRNSSVRPFGEALPSAPVEWATESAEKRNTSQASSSSDLFRSSSSEQQIKIKNKKQNKTFFFFFQQLLIQNTF